MTIIGQFQLYGAALLTAIPELDMNEGMKAKRNGFMPAFWLFWVCAPWARSNG